ncbi:hypothetical protein F4678DRAFT_477490 [Xylaria arbuscula]|nr:hypothetical protein F4678DRAFT_477490 [Xylaria arbuscula]
MSSSSTTSSAREPRWALHQVRVIRYLTERIFYRRKVTPRTTEWFLNTLWPEGLSQGIYQLLDVKSPSLIDEATSSLATCEAERKAIICDKFAEQVQDTRCITPALLKGLLIALSGSINVSVARHELHVRWTLCQAHDIIHLGNQIQLEKDVTQETMDWFVRAMWPNSSSQAITRPLRHSAHSIDSVDECPVSPAIRDEFVGLVLGATKITDLIMDWLYQALFRSSREGSLYVNAKDPFSDDEDRSNTLDKEISGDDNPSQTQSDLSCGSGTADSNKENMLPLQSPATLEIWDLGSTTLDDKSLDYSGELAIEARSQFEEAAGSLLQLSRDAGHGLADNSRLHDGPAPFEQSYQGGGGHNGSSCVDNDENDTELQRMPAKRGHVEDNNRPYKRVKVSGDLIFTIRAVHIGRRGDEDEALNYDSESSVKYDIVPILAAFPE